MKIGDRIIFRFGTKDSERGKIISKYPNEYFLIYLNSGKSFVVHESLLTYEYTKENNK